MKPHDVDAARRETLERALAEDAPHGDVTGEAYVPADAVSRVAVTAREAGVCSGLDVLAEVFALVDPAVEVLPRTADGRAVAAGTVLAEVRGPARAVLRGERVALNLLQRMCAIATTTAAHVEAARAAGADARVTDTRKTAPGLRVFDRQAVRDGGGHNHRRGLSDAVMLKDNHWAAMGLADADGTLTASDAEVTAALRAGRARLPHTVHIEVEVDRLEQIPPVLAAGVDTIMLDNFSLADLRAGVELIGGRALVEASGGVTLETIGPIAATGVDIVSVGALTHSVRALDIGFDAVAA